MKDRNLDHSDNWATPEYLYKSLDSEFNFDFDPCPLELGEITPENNGLLKEWGYRNFINPPYSKKVKEAFVKKAIKVSKEGRLCVLLLPVSTSTKLFHEFLLPQNPEICFLKGRVKFEGINTFGEKVTTKCGMHDSMLVVLDGRSNKEKCMGGRIRNKDRNYFLLENYWLSK